MIHLNCFVPNLLPKEYASLAGEVAADGPNVLREALKLYGLKERPGRANAPEIIEMAEYLGGVIEDFYTKDEIPWCGLFVAYCIKRAKFDPPANYSQVRARDYAKWGTPVDTPARGDVLSFWRGSPSGRDGHVGFYIQESDEAYYVLGGNQGDRVSIVPIAKERLIAARRCPWRVAEPKGVKPVFIGSRKDKLSENEA